MDQPLTRTWMDDQDQRISEAVARERHRLRNFIRKRLGDEEDVEDILQDVFYELVEAYRLMKPVEQVGAWLFRVARNRIIDLFRKRRPEAAGSHGSDIAEVAGIAGIADRAGAEDGEPHRRRRREPLVSLEAGLEAGPETGPEADYARGVLSEELEAALDELPEEQREVFVAHELEGRSFKEIAAATGVNVNTLLSRKHYAVAHLRRRLRAIYDEYVNT
jgi:RNA polymerase sigma factor (sigma-70 family)